MNVLSTFINLMKKIEDYVSAARSFNLSSKNNSDLKVIEKPKNEDGYYKGSAEYVFNDGVIIQHSWDGGIYAGYKDYDHDIEVVNDAGHEFDQKSLSYGMQRSRRL